MGSPAFGKDAKGQVIYLGDESRMKVAVGDNRRMNLNMPGTDAFVKVIRDDGKGNKVGVGFFKAIDDLANAVKTRITLICNAVSQKWTPCNKV